MFFMEIKNLEKLEKDQKWQQAIDMLYNYWIKDINNSDVLLRLATECWYVMFNWNFLDIEKTGLDYEKVQSILINAYKHFMENCKNHNNGVAVFGYMISLFPNCFYSDNDKDGKIYLQYEQRGKNLLKLAYENEPENKLYKKLYLQSIGKNVQDDDKVIEKLVKQLFPQNTEIEKYFKDVLSNY